MLPKIHLKLFPIVLAVFTLSLFMGEALFGAETSTNNQIQPPVDYTTSNPQLHYYTQNVLLEVMSAVSCQLAGLDPTNPQGKCLGIDSKTGKIAPVENNGGAIGFMSGLVASAFNIPVSSGQYIAYTTSNFGIAKNTYADHLSDPNGDVFGEEPTQGSTTTFNTGYGFKGLGPFMNIWKAFRNIVYLGFVLIMTIVGLGIMFRIKIDPRTVMTIQNQLPKIVVALVLVTLSYAIVGFMIDVMYLSMHVVYGVVENSGLDVSSLNPVELQGRSPFAAFGGVYGIGDVAKDSAGGIGNIISTLFNGSAGRLIATAILGILGGIVGGSINPLAGGLIGGILGGAAGFIGASKLMGFLGSVIAFIILAVAILWALFRLWFALIRSYIFVLLGLILAPFWIAAGVLPGKPLGFEKWFRDMAANLMVFPATLFMFLVGKALIDSVSKKGTIFTPPMIGDVGNANALGAILGLGILLLTPQVVQMVRDALKAPANKYAAGVGQSIAGGQALLGAVAKPLASRFVAKNQQGQLIGPLGGLLTNLSAGRYAQLPQNATLGQRIQHRLSSNQVTRRAATLARFALGGRT